MDLNNLKTNKIMKQTAVEWLKKEIDPINKTQIEWHEIFDQAKEMEKQQKGYSEEEVLDILFSMSVDNPNDITEWFEKFKNK